MKLIRTQQGITLLGFLMAIVFAGFIMLIGLRVAPLYLHDYAIGSAISSLAEEPLQYAQLDQDLSTAIKTKLQKRFEINDVRDVSPNKIEVDRTASGLEVSLNYDAETTLFANVDLIIHFSHNVLVPIK